MTQFHPGAAASQPEVQCSGGSVNSGPIKMIIIIINCPLYRVWSGAGAFPAKGRQLVAHHPTKIPDDSCSISDQVLYEMGHAFQPTTGCNQWDCHQNRLQNWDADLGCGWRFSVCVCNETITWMVELATELGLVCWNIKSGGYYLNCLPGIDAGWTQHYLQCCWCLWKCNWVIFRFLKLLHFVPNDIIKVAIEINCQLTIRLIDNQNASFNKYSMITMILTIVYSNTRKNSPKIYL